MIHRLIMQRFGLTCVVRTALALSEITLTKKVRARILLPDRRAGGCKMMESAVMTAFLNVIFISVDIKIWISYTEFKS